ncbi:mannitol dehydrogenase family protein [Sporolactobacillus shoreicorticis]|uniref:Mannitol dehydrogenase family protein n=1 Tax=Sporolactobacillus shoreicorticis TaxID=1923877 RepID=A0ABW5S0F9_9BACL|nr:mannitol dehydrogenase family protein [Sporolactobacillus shoreicorticis]MCO7124722.1 mannitol dehydrogenase family protein [Sporolactobacillus shoreicorticis]
MVRLVDDYLKNKDAFKTAGIRVPTYDQSSVKKATDQAPTWIHFGGGNIFRCLHAAVNQTLLNEGLNDKGILVVDTWDDEVISKTYHAFKNRTLSVITRADGQFDKELIASVTGSYYFNASAQEDWNTVVSVFKKPSLQIASFTITEKGYGLTDVNGNLTKLVQSDIETGPLQPKNTMAQVTYLLYERFKAGAHPLAMLSTDNFSQNGDKLKKSVLTIAKGWLENSKAERAFIDYLEDGTKVSFPLSMIDRITPNPSEEVAKLLHKDSFEDTEIIHTAKHTNTAPFVNTEEVHYLVIEDHFPNGRPALEKGGVYMVDRDTVNNADEMKVTTCLNPLHTALAINGCLLGYHSIADEMKDEDLVQLIKKVGYTEGLPVVTDPKIINPKAFIDQVVEKRLPNPFTPDTPQRIVTDTSQKLAIRYGETIKSYIAHPELDVKQLTFIPLVIATWVRYLIGKDDAGENLELRPDPLLDSLTQLVSGVELGNPVDVHTVLHPILTNTGIFGVDLYKAELGEKIEGFFEKLIAGPGAVRKTIHDTLQAY